MDQQPALRGVAPRAGFWQRFLALLIDSVLLAVVAAVLRAVLLPDADVGVGANRSTVLNIALSIIYFTILEGGSGQTLGKRLLGIRVVDFETGAPIDYGRAFVRSIGRQISGFVLLLGYLWMLWDRDRQTWHDKMASTTVVPVSRSALPPPPTA